MHRAPKYTERIVQFGEGNFLRAFTNWMVHEMNKKASFDAGVVVVQPIAQGLVDKLNDQDGLYTLFLNGIKNGEAASEHLVVDCIRRGINPYTEYQEYLALAENPDLRFVISNTTEAGITYKAEDQLISVPPSSFPAKLTALLFRRFLSFDGALDKGLIILPCELIDKNGDQLKRIILRYATAWDLPDLFVHWIEDYNYFCNTLVDRIVPGYPKSKIAEINEVLAYQDGMVVEGEQFHLWVVEGPEIVKKEIPSETCGLNLVFTDDIEPYRSRKVRILNGAHTSMVPLGYLYGMENVRETVTHESLGPFIKELIFDEICPTLDLPEEELTAFALDTLDRFKNPYLEHSLLSIALNSIAKFKTRVLPSLLEFHNRKGWWPEKLCLSLSALLVFYRGEHNGKVINLQDDQYVIDFAEQTWMSHSNGEIDLRGVAQEFLGNTAWWGQDLSQLIGLEEQVTGNLTDILNSGIEIAREQK